MPSLWPRSHVGMLNGSDRGQFWMHAAWRVHSEKTALHEYIDGMMRNSPEPILAFPK